MIITVDLYETRHACPANPEPHTLTRQHSIVDITPGGTCRTPVTIRIGNQVRRVACRRHEPAERQCLACRPLFIVRDTIHTDLGWQGPIHLAPCKHTEVTA
jgi:hypothetical protein